MKKKIEIKVSVTKTLKKVTSFRSNGSICVSEVSETFSEEISEFENHHVIDEDIHYLNSSSDNDEHEYYTGIFDLYNYSRSEILQQIESNQIPETILGKWCITQESSPRSVSVISTSLVSSVSTCSEEHFAEEFQEVLDSNFRSNDSDVSDSDSDEEVVKAKKKVNNLKFKIKTLIDRFQTKRRKRKLEKKKKKKRDVRKTKIRTLVDKFQENRNKRMLVDKDTLVVSPVKQRNRKSKKSRQRSKKSFSKVVFNSTPQNETKGLSAPVVALFEKKKQKILHRIENAKRQPNPPIIKDDQKRKKKKLKNSPPTKKTSLNRLFRLFSKKKNRIGPSRTTRHGRQSQNHGK